MQEKLASAHLIVVSNRFFVYRCFSMWLSSTEDLRYTRALAAFVTAKHGAILVIQSIKYVLILIIYVA